ncbi:hypothetical protein ACFOY4_40215 [Actinomadura syzygii]|uniref:Uncharacterized protein n=1 Tax=Actinomadura syzygii TaxID=1427538 RepID=A0A5D0UA83_9ACTN|nr:hypothetical protein [Actinomadura syzygii]TYC14582.1 hypothetical protein FXF65_17205 [Actinomadura syzygii]
MTADAETTAPAAGPATSGPAASGPAASGPATAEEAATALDAALDRLAALAAASSATGYEGRVVRATGELVACAAELVLSTAVREPDGEGTALRSAVDDIEHVLRRLRWIRSVHFGGPQQDVQGKEREVP